MGAHLNEVFFIRKILITLIIVTFLQIQPFATPGFCQSLGTVRLDGTQSNNVLTSVPFLLITPGARSGAMGNAGVAINADGNSPSLNMASMAYLKDGAYGISVNYSPWLKNLTEGMSLSYLSAYYRINERNTLAASLRYFSIGNITFLDNNQQELGVFNPNEFAADVSCARSFGPGFSLGGSLRFIYSNLYSGQFNSEGQTGTGSALAVDVSGLYKTDTYLFASPAVWSIGVNISNIGTKISYSIGDNPYFLPANLKVGTAATLLGKDSKIIIALDLNKLLVPTQPIYNNDGSIGLGRNPERSVPSGIFGSFSDAPGGFSEELKEVGLSTGFEFSFKDRFAIRAGYNYQNRDKGNNNYLTLGAGLKYNVITIDFSYLVGSVNTNPLANTLRFGLQFTFDRANKNK